MYVAAMLKPLSETMHGAMAVGIVFQSIRDFSIQGRRCARRGNRELSQGVTMMMPVHPGRILKRELEARGLSANRLALALRVPSGRITQILNGKRAITPETALRLACYFDNAAQFWMNLQTKCDLLVAERAVGQRVKAEVGDAA